LSCRAKTPGDLLIWLPRWAAGESVRLSVNGAPAPLKTSGAYAVVSADALGRDGDVVLRHSLPEKLTSERFPSGRVFRFRWRGDKITGISPNDDPRPFYPTLPT